MAQFTMGSRAPVYRGAAIEQERFADEGTDMAPNDILIGQLMGELKGLQASIAQQFESLNARMSRRDEERAEDRKILLGLTEAKQKTDGFMLGVKAFAAFCGVGSLAAIWSSIIKPVLSVLAR
jgi:hypothetical protein